MSTRAYTNHTALPKPTPAAARKGSHKQPASPARTAAGGQTLDKRTQREMSARFGHDFSHVRVHTDSPAEKTADMMGAHAYTTGSDIVFGEGRYNPGSRQTDRILAHELAHVVQQDRYGAGEAKRKSRRSDPAEVEAERAADQALMGNEAEVQSVPSAAISCFDPAYNDVKDDFWNTKSVLGNHWGSVADSAINTVWDGIGAIPEVGSLLSTGVDLGKSGYSEGMSTLEGWEADLTGNTADRMRSQQYDEAAKSFLGDAAVDATGMIPGYGTYESVTAGGYDAMRTIDLATGTDPSKAPPSSGDLQKKAAGGVWNYLNPPAPAATPDPNAASDPDQPPPNMPSDPFQGMQ